ncbi:hypothetical protein [Pseudomonas mosselii]|uniref:hypothetical protein n=1 Tax=Pseudomonas mosselii TaxID=78327 RepID=UPI000BB4EECA|nr:hypothetical protein [Pseudomonas mosselii]ATB65901.1 hypothetical protein CLJ08_15125 [Pseudomonas mosselii]MDH1100798.1 hypothetical protein [Pseudomonas mosselii]UVN44027.1 hypothetical protein NW905_23510 [Pseudomonas mosselii]
MGRSLARLLQGLALIPVAYLFVCLMVASVGQSTFSLELPTLTDPDSNSTAELMLGTLPAQLLFLLLSMFFASRQPLVGTFVLAGTLAAWLQCQVFAEHFGTTWSSNEILMLLGVNAPWLALALPPGLALLLGIERLHKQSA